VASFVGDIMMPLVGTLLGGADFSNYFFVLKQGATPGPYATLAAVKAAGGVAIGYGVLINTLVNFLIVAFALFMVIKAMNAAKRKEEAAPAAPAAPTKEEVLLTEIRDLLARR
jgi:large conductance mechanosensitive channel